MNTIHLRKLLSIRTIATAGVLTLPVWSSVARAQDGPPRDAEQSESRPRPPEERSDRPDGERREGFDRGMDREGPRDRFDRGRFRPLQLPSEEEWVATLQFMKDHAPNMSRKIAESNNLSTMAQERLKSAAFTQYRNLRELERDNLTLYEVKLKLLTGRDTLFGLMADLREADEDKASEFRQKIRDQMRQMVELSFEERELRLADLERRMTRERELLQRDRDRLDEIVENRFKAEVERDPRTESVLPEHEGPGGPGGPRPHGRPPEDQPREGRDRVRDLAPADDESTTQPAVQ